MIEFFSETNFELEDTNIINEWIADTIHSEEHKIGSLNFVFCDDQYLHKLNVDFLNHDTLTDIITFDYNLGKEVHGEIYISIDRVKDNASNFKVSFNNEIHRVIIHGVLHLCGYKDKTESEKELMRNKEDYYLKQF